MKKNLKQYLKKIHYSIPPEIRTIYMFLINMIKKLSYIYLPVHVYSFLEKESENTFKFAYIGWDIRIANYYLTRFGNEIVPEKKRIYVFAWNINRYLRKNRLSYDAAIVEIVKYTNSFVNKETGFLMPRWLDMQLDTEVFQKKSQKLDITRRIRKHSLTFKVTTGEEDFKLFYYRMYIPFISARHKDSAVLSDYKHFRKRFKKKKGKIRLILKEDQPIAGSYIEKKWDMLQLAGVGVLDGNSEYLKMGAIGATYYFTLQECIKNGISKMHMGGTSPILTDGLTKFKLSLGAEAVNADKFGRLWLWFVPLKDSVAMRNILKSNPIVYKSKNKIYRSLFINQNDYDDKMQFIKVWNRSYCGNIERTIINCFGETDKIEEWVNEEDMKDTLISVFNFNV